MLFLFFISGLLLANGIPHFINEISGRKFHSPFAKPPIKGLSSPVVNVIWGITNFVISLVILSFLESLTPGINPSFVLFISGFISTAIGLSATFDKLDNQ